MAVIYFPSSTNVSQRVVTGSSYIQTDIGVYPNIIFFFDTASQIQSYSQSIFPITVSYANTVNTASFAFTSSYSNTASFVTTSSFCNTASISISSSFAATASFATTASFAMNGGSGPGGGGDGFTSISQSYQIISASATNWVTLSFVGVPNRYWNMNTASPYSFTASNLPASTYVADILLYITNSVTATSSLSFPATWINLGAGWPTSLTASKSAVLWLRATDTGIIMGSFTSQL